MRFKEWEEDHFIEYLSKLFPSKGHLFGIGDDSAVIPQADGTAYLVTTDALVEGVHFLKNQISAKDLGYKTVAVNVSDIAAMGGEPKYAFLSLALPKTTDRSWGCQMIEGIKEACDKWDILLLGGDTVGSKRDLFLNLTLIGSASQEHIKYRNRAECEDVICVTSYLGDSGGGLKALQTEAVKTDAIQSLIHAHFHPEPCPKQGLWLSSHSKVHAMMDISDGLDCDLRRLLKSSKKGAVIETALIPLSPSLSKVCQDLSWDPLQLALVGGEDYCLLLTVAPEAFDALQKAFQQQFNHPLFAIGRINACSNELIYQRKTKPFVTNYTPYRHFQ